MFNAQVVQAKAPITCLGVDVFQLLIEKYDFNIECGLRLLNKESRRIVNEITSCRKGVMYILTNECDDEIKSFAGETWMNFISRNMVKTGSYELKIVNCGGQEIVGEKIVFDSVYFVINEVTFCNFQTRLEKKFEMFAVKRISYRNCSQCPVEFINSYNDNCGVKVDIMTRRLLFNKCLIDNVEWFQGQNFWVTVDANRREIQQSTFTFINCVINLNGFGCAMEFPSFYFNNTIFKDDSFYNCFHNSTVYSMMIDFEESKNNEDDRFFNDALPAYNDWFELVGIPTVLPLMRIHHLFVDCWDLTHMNSSNISREMLISIYDIIEYDASEFYRDIRSSVYERDPVNSDDAVDYLTRLILGDFDQDDDDDNPYTGEPDFLRFAQEIQFSEDESLEEENLEQDE